MRARNIKPGFFANEDLAEIDPMGRLLFAGLWMLADRAGRLEDRPRRIKGSLFPYEDCDVDSLLNDLQSYEFLKRYEIEGKKYIQILNFNKHQNPHKCEKPSEIPPFDGYEQERDVKSTVQVQYKYGASTIQEQDKHSTNPADSLNPDSLNPDSLNTDTFECEESHSDDGGSPKESIKDIRFAEFWKLYPKKVGKGAVKKVYERIVRTEYLHQKIISALIQQKESIAWTKDNGQYIPNPLTWMNQSRWEDELPMNNGTSLRVVGKSNPFEEYLARSDEEDGREEGQGAEKEIGSNIEPIFKSIS